MVAKAQVTQLRILVGSPLCRPRLTFLHLLWGHVRPVCITIAGHYWKANVHRASISLLTNFFSSHKIINWLLTGTRRHLETITINCKPTVCVCALHRPCEGVFYSSMQHMGSHKVKHTSIGIMMNRLEMQSSCMFVFSHVGTILIITLATTKTDFCTSVFVFLYKERHRIKIKKYKKYDIKTQLKARE